MFSLNISFFYSFAVKTVNLPATLAGSQWELSDSLVVVFLRLFFFFLSPPFRWILAQNVAAHYWGKEASWNDEDEDESKKSKRQRFNTKWTIGDNGKVREWLIYDRSTDEMYCSDCRMYGSEKAKSNPFVIGTKNLKLEAIKDHDHQKATYTQ